MTTFGAHLVSDAVINLIASTREILSDFRSDLSLRVSEPFLSGVEAVVNAVAAFHDNRQESVTRLENDVAFQKEQSRFYGRVCLQILINIHEDYLPLLYASKENNEYLILPSIKRAVAWFQSDVDLTLLPDFRFNYTYNGGLENFVERTIDRLEAHLDTANKGAVRSKSQHATPRWTTFIHFPRSHRDSALDLVVIIHEIGHLIDQTCQLYKKFLPITLDRATFTKELEDICNSPIATQQGAGSGSQLTFESVWGRAALEAQFTRLCIETVEQWTRELIADCLAIRLMGPAYLFSFTQLLCLGDNEPSHSHPAPIYRLSLLLEELRDLGYGQEKVRLRPILGDLEKTIASELPTIKYAGAHLVAQRSLEQLVPRIQKEIRNFTVGNEYKSEHYESEVPDVLELLTRGIAPIEVRDPKTGKMQPVSVTTIINSGWELYKTKLEDFYSLFSSSVSMSQRLKILNDLIFKAVEASEVMRVWQSKAQTTQT